MEGEISMYYDPMIAKLVTYGSDRGEAIERMKDALDEYVIEGVSHNVSLCHDIMCNETYINGDTNTDFIKNEYGEKGFTVNFTPEKEKNLLCLTALIYDAHRRRAAAFDYEAGQFEAFQDSLNMNVQEIAVQLKKNSELVSVKILPGGMDGEIWVKIGDEVNADPSTKLEPTNETRVYSRWP